MPQQNIIFVDLQASTLALDFRVTVLEQNGGSDGNSSVAELEVQVEALEGTTADHEIRISATEADVNGNVTRIVYLFSIVYQSVKYLSRKEFQIDGHISDLQGTVADHETRLTAAEENIQGAFIDSSFNLRKSYCNWEIILLP